MTMTLNEVLVRQNFVNQIALKNGENELPKDLKVKVMSMRIALNKIRNQHEEDSKEAAEGLKPSDFDTLAQKQDRTKEEDEKFNKMYEALVDEHNAFLIEKGKEEVEFDKTFTEEEFESLIEVNSNDVEINGTKISGADFLEVIYTLLVE